MQLNSKYDLISATPIVGGHACLAISDVLAQEAFAAFEAGSGVGTPDSEGSPVPGTLLPGQVVTMNTSGYWELATSPTLGTPSLPILMGVMHDGDEDFDGAATGKPVVLIGPCEILTPHYTGGSFPPGSQVTVSAGLFVLKSVAASTVQAVGRVGNRGLNSATGVLHVMFGVP